MLIYAWDCCVSGVCVCVCSRKLCDEKSAIQLQLESATDELVYDLAQTDKLFFLPGSFAIYDSPM